MSTKLYDGVRLAVGPGIKDLLALQADLRKTMSPVLQAEYAKLCNRAAAYAAMARFGQTPSNEWTDWSQFKNLDPGKFAIHVDHALRDAIANAESARTILNADMDLSLSFRLAVLPAYRKTLAVPFTENQALSQAFLNHPAVSEYGYWDNTDRPEDLSRKQWDARKRAWNQALPGIGVPREHGLVLTILDENDIRYDARNQPIPDRCEIIRQTVLTEVRLNLIDAAATREQVSSLSDVLRIDHSISQDQVTAAAGDLPQRVLDFILAKI